MIKSQLIQKLADRNPHLFQRDVEKIVTTILDEVVDAMSRGNRVELRGFGAFTVKRRPGRKGRNPRTGESVEVDEKHIPFFKTGKELRERLNEQPLSEAVSGGKGGAKKKPARKVARKTAAAKASARTAPGKRAGRNGGDAGEGDAPRPSA